MTTSIIILTTVALAVALISQFLSEQSTHSQSEAIPVPIKERNRF